jgi:hypothetical protein
MVEEKVVFTIIEWGEEDSYFLPPTSTAAGDVLPFEVSGDRFHFEVLAIGTSKADAIRIADMDPSWFENKKNYPEDIKYHVIRISPLPSS